MRHPTITNSVSHSTSHLYITNSTYHKLSESSKSPVFLYFLPPFFPLFSYRNITNSMSHLNTTNSASHLNTLPCSICPPSFLPFFSTVYSPANSTNSVSHQNITNSASHLNTLFSSHPSLPSSLSFALPVSLLAYLSLSLSCSLSLSHTHTHTQKHLGAASVGFAGTVLSRTHTYIYSISLFLNC